MGSSWAHLLAGAGGGCRDLPQLEPWPAAPHNTWPNPCCAALTLLMPCRVCVHARAHTQMRVALNSYAKQLKSYEDAVIAKRLEELSEEEVGLGREGSSVSREDRRVQGEAPGRVFAST